MVWSGPGCSGWSAGDPAHAERINATSAIAGFISTLQEFIDSDFQPFDGVAQRANFRMRVGGSLGLLDIRGREHPYAVEITTWRYAYDDVPVHSPLVWRGCRRR